MRSPGASVRISASCRLGSISTVVLGTRLSLHRRDSDAGRLRVDKIHEVNRVTSKNHGGRIPDGKGNDDGISRRDFRGATGGRPKQRPYSGDRFGYRKDLTHSE